jgi:hypothetical protein
VHLEQVFPRDIVNTLFNWNTISARSITLATSNVRIAVPICVAAIFSAGISLVRLFPLSLCDKLTTVMLLAFILYGKFHEDVTISVALESQSPFPMRPWDIKISATVRLEEIWHSGGLVSVRRRDLKRQDNDITNHEIQNSEGNTYLL